MSERATNIHAAKVYLVEARRRRRQSFGFVLLEWAGNAGRSAMAGLLRKACSYFTTRTESITS